MPENLFDNLVIDSELKTNQSKISDLSEKEANDTLEQLRRDKQKESTKAETNQEAKAMIDLSAAPRNYEDLFVSEHRGSGKFEFDPSKIYFYSFLNEEKRSGKDLKKELADKSVLNANVLDYLLANPEKIPEEWKGKNVFFWGTIYLNHGGEQYVRYLYWTGSKWDSWHSYLSYEGFDPSRISTACFN